MQPRQLAKRMLARLFEDEHYIFVHKPAGLSVYSPVAGRPWGVVEAFQALIGESRCPSGLIACYQLERYASGVLGLAKTQDAARRLHALIKTGPLREGDSLRRQYVAVVKGRFKGRVGHRPVCSLDKRVHDPPYKRRTRIAPATARAGVRESLDVELIRQFPGRALVRCTHDGPGGKLLRALLAKRSPILGDARFDRRPEARQTGRLYLHLERIEFKHPFSGKAISVKSPTPASFAAAAGREDPLIDRLEVALAARLPCLLDRCSDSYRLIDGRADGVSGLVAERFGEVVVLQTQQGKFQGGWDSARAAAAWYGRTLGVRAVYAKNAPRDRSRCGTGLQPVEGGSKPVPHSLEALYDPTPVWGDPVEPEITIREDYLNFLIRPYDGFSVGLFLDHREDRLVLKSLAKGKRVLNTFAYTCAFSVAAAAGGAVSTVSVDISKRALEWGKRNFAANDIPSADHRFICSDTFDYFKRAHRQGGRFDVIILDPPTFSRSKKPPRTFQISKDLARLIEGALQLLEPNGIMLVSTNDRRLSAGWLREQIAAAAGPRPFTFLNEPPTPVDSTYSRHITKTVFVRF